MISSAGCSIVSMVVVMIGCIAWTPRPGHTEVDYISWFNCSMCNYCMHVGEKNT